VLGKRAIARHYEQDDLQEDLARGGDQQTFCIPYKLDLHGNIEQIGHLGGGIPYKSDILEV